MSIRATGTKGALVQLAKVLAADHAARLRKPMVMVKVGKTEAGRSILAQDYPALELVAVDRLSAAIAKGLRVTASAS